MLLDKEKTMRDSECFLKRTEVYQNYQDSDDNFKIEYVLAKRNTAMPEDVIAFAICISGYNDEVISFHPYKNEEIMHLDPSWSFSYDTDLFSYLEDGYEIVGMPLEAHFHVWFIINESHNSDEIEYEKGMQIYLGYCKKNDITKEKLVEEYSYKGMDVMILYDGKTQANFGIT